MKNKKTMKVISTLITMGIGGLLGGSIGYILIPLFDQQPSFLIKLFYILCILILIYISFLFNLIIHECGHLIFGLLTGYHFSSIRFGKIMLIKKDGKIKFKRYSLMGTGGQCLLSPPNWNNGKVPYVLYNMGGVILNLLVLPLFGLLAFIFLDIPFLSALLASIALLSLFIVITNGIPLSFSPIQNDAQNTVSVSRHPQALRAYWIQLKLSESLSHNIRVKDLPSEWFFLPDPDALQNGLIATVGIYKALREIDLLHFEQAKEDIQYLLDNLKNGMPIHHNMLMCERIFCEMITTQDSTLIEKINQKPLKQYLKVSKHSPSCIRTLYTYELLYQKNVNKANTYYQTLLKMAASYPYPSEIESELEIIHSLNAFYKNEHPSQ